MEEKEQEKEESRKNLEKQNLNVFVKRNIKQEKSDTRRKEEKPEDNLFFIIPVTLRSS
jgi:spore cortex formation protein SpoVR/YcgB (stage V sporulation)